MIIQEDVTGARVQALSITIGLFTFVSVGVAACLALVMALFYFAVSFVLFMLQALVEVFSMMSATWVNADPLLEIIILAAVAYGGYRFYRFRVKRGGTYA